MKKELLLFISFLLMSYAVFGQTINIKGSVHDDTGEAVIGANVTVVGTSNISITDASGNFTLSNVLPNATLQFSSFGFTTLDVPVNGRTEINVTMTFDVTVIEEMVVVGYGTMRKSDVTGSISSVKGDDVARSQSFGALDALRGKASGVTIFGNSSQPGYYTNNVIIRGVATVRSGTQPLYVVDGVAMEDFGIMNPNDIESMEVLKDASATAIYGARGANGVILVTTKRGGEAGKGAKISYQGSMTVSSVSKYMETLNAQEWCDAFMIGLANENKYQGMKWSLNPADWFTDPNFFTADGKPIYDTDWQRESFRTSFSHNHQINVQYGGDKMQMGTFLNFTDSQGIVLNSWNKRVNAKFAFEAQPTKWLSTSFNLTVNHTWGRYAAETGGGQEARRTWIEMLPWYPVKDSAGEYTHNATSSMAGKFGFEGMTNPVSLLELQYRRNNNTKIFGNFAFTFHLLPGLDFRTQLGVDGNLYDYQYYSSVKLTNISKPDGRASYSHNNSYYWQEESYLTYNKQFGDHRVNVMAGASWSARTSTSAGTGTARGFSDDFYLDWNLGVATTPATPSSSWSHWAMNSYFLRAMYNYKDRYSLTVTGRYDGSSRFGESNKYAFFPSAGLAWNIANEEFLKDKVDALSSLRLHTSYGITGNSEIGNYSSLARVSSSTSLLDGQRASVSYVSSLANPDLEWEKTAQWDIGAEVGFFRDRLFLDASYYRKKTTDLILSCPVPRTTGFSSITKNIGSVGNYGVDFLLRGIPFETTKFRWTSTLILNYNKNKVLALGENNEDIQQNSFVSGANSIIRVGESLSSFYGYVRYGVYTEEDYQNGECRLNQVGRAKRSADKEIIGKGIPDWTGSWNNQLQFGPFDLSFELQFVWGVETTQQYYHSVYDRFGITNGLKNILYDAYDGTNPETMQQAIYLCNSGHAGQNTRNDSQWVCDGSYLRINQAQLGYTLPAKALRSLHLSALRLYVSGNNLYTFTSPEYTGYDPESTSQGSNNAFGQNLTFFAYPRARSFILGINVTF